MLEASGDIVSIGVGALAVGYVLYEIDRRQRRLHEIWDVLGSQGRGSYRHARRHGSERRVAALRRRAIAVTAT